MNPDDKNQALLLQLIFMFQSAALQQMGKLKNVMTDKVERNLPQAQFYIDMLEMFQVKTKGNLAVEEEKALKQVLQELRLNYVDEAMKQQAEEKAAESAPQASGQASEENGGKPETASEPPPEKPSGNA